MNPKRHAAGGSLERGPGLMVLCVALLAVVLLQPVLSVEGHPSMLAELLVASVPIAGTYAVRGRSWQLRVALLLLSPVVVLWVCTHVGGLPGLRAWELAAALALMSFVSVCLLHCLLHASEVTRSVVFGAAGIYLLLGFAWAHAYALAIELREDAFSSPIRDWNELTYYSFSTLTTLGLGDVVPISPMARMLTSLEAVAGVLFVGFVVARFAAALSSRKEPR
ncbi:MAG: potassium channel family protein [Sandaracinaceae bacterium]